MAKIRVLSDRLINKIAAGEVVGRPSSALKELMENSLDAGAGELRVDLESGGKKLIRVVDDGEGMDEDDLLLALERHATSKIARFEDLEAVSTLGFRGEALPSIAAVSDMTIRSRARGAAEGREVIVSGGVIRDVRPAAVAPGTSVEVRHIFGRVPARRKFLRSVATEYGHCQNIVIHYALAFPEIKFSLRHNGADQIDGAPVSTLRERITQLVGRELAGRLVAVEEHDGRNHVVGFVAEPSLNRASTAMTHFFVNRRAVRDKVLIHALRAAYDDLLPKGRSPIAYLFLEVPPEMVDVNVHPAKAEIRFRQAGLVHDLVTRAVREALSVTRPLASARPREPRQSTPGLSGKPSAADSAGGHSSTLQSLDRALSARRAENSAAKKAKMDFRSLNALAPLGRERAQAGTSPAAAYAREGKAVEGCPAGHVGSPTTAGAQLDPAELLPLGQVDESYIVARYPGGLIIVDQHAAHERVIYEQLFSIAAGEAHAQGLLHPLVIDLPPAHARLLEEHAGELAELGLAIEPFGVGGVTLRSLPASLSPGVAVELIVNMAEDLQSFGRVDPARLRHELVVSAACHGAIKINTRLSTAKQRWLLESLFSCRMPMRCPHGRPTVLKMDSEELRRRFGRS